MEARLEWEVDLTNGNKLANEIQWANETGVGDFMWTTRVSDGVKWLFCRKTAMYYFEKDFITFIREKGYNEKDFINFIREEGYNG